MATSGTPEDCSWSTIGSPACADTSSAPSTWPAATNRVTRSRSAEEDAMQKNSPMSWSASAWVQPRSSTEKFGSPNRRSCGSDSTNATDPERCVTSDRAW